MQKGEYLSTSFSVAQIGARRHYIVARALESAGALSRLYTDFCIDGTPLEALDICLPAVLKRGPMGRLLARRVSGVPGSRIRRFPSFAFGRALGARGRQDRAGRMARWVQFNERFGKLVLDALDGDDADGFYVFNGAGLEILAHCRQRGLRAVLDQTIAPLSYERKLLQEEREPWPEWFFSPEGPGEAAAELTRREKTEWQLADTVVCGSEFVRCAVGLEGGPHDKCAVVPYGMARLKTGLNTPGRDVNGPLRVLFAGTVTPRKGIQYLLSAARELAGKGFEFRAVGPIAIPDVPLRQLRRFVDVVGPVPRSAMRAQYTWSDVLVHPTLCEGSANVCYEALANGVPVVTTPNAGSVVRDGLDGFIVPIRDPDAIAVKLEMLRRHQQLRVQMSRSAVDRASKFTWYNYAGRLLSVLVGGGTSAGDP